MSECTARRVKAAAAACVRCVLTRVQRSEMSAMYCVVQVYKEDSAKIMKYLVHAHKSVLYVYRTTTTTM